MFRLYADIETQFGKAILDILKKQYPDQDVNESPATVGHKLMAIARRQLQNNDTDAMDAIQDLLTYLTTGSMYETDESGKIQYGEIPTGEVDDEGNPVTEHGPLPRAEAKEWDFAKDSDTWEEALKKIYSNLRTTAMSRSKGKTRRKQQERSIDDAFGRRTDDGGSEEGEARMPTPDDTELGKALDDQAAVKQFSEVIEDYAPELEERLSPDTRKLWQLIFEENEGGFGSDVKENMGQATALKEMFPELYEKNAKRWSGFVGDLRKKLLSEITEILPEIMTPGDFAVLRDTFFADVDPSAVRRQEKQKEQEKKDYQRGLDERKVARLKAKAEEGELSPKDKKDLDRLSKRLEEQGVDVEAIKPDASAGSKKKKKAPEERASAASLARRMSMAAALAARSYGP